MSNSQRTLIIALLAVMLNGCVAFHTGYITDSTALSQANFSYVDISSTSYFDTIDDDKDILLTTMRDTIVGKITTLEMNPNGRVTQLSFEKDSSVRKVPVTILSNYRHKGVWRFTPKTEGTATATYVLGIGGLNRQALVEEAKSELKQRLPLSDNQAYVNITVNWKTSYIIFGIIMRVKCTVTTDIVEFKK